MSRRRFILLDRDGTILVAHPYLSDPALAALLPGVGSALRQLRECGYGLIVITNQSAVGRGYFDHKRLDLIHRRMCALLRKEGIQLDGIYICPHRPEDNCPCRKPNPGLVEQAAKEHGFAPESSIVVGDNVCDMHLGERLGARTFLVRTGYGAQTAISGKVNPNYVVDNLWAAAQIIKRLPIEGSLQRSAVSLRRN